MSQAAAFFTTFERRISLAGDVAALLDASDRLIVVADEAEAAIYVERISDAVRDGLRVRGDNGTTVNGRLSFEVAAARGISFDFRGSDATLVVSNTRIAGSIDVRFASGDNRLTIRRSRVSGNVSIAGGDSTDAIEMRDVTVQRELRAGGGAGRDRLRLNRVSVDGGLAWHDRKGASALSLARSTIAGDASLDTGNSIDRVSFANVAFDGATAVRVARGNDAIFIRGTTFADSPTIDAGPGLNEVDRELIFEWSFAEDAAGWRAGLSDFSAGTPPPSAEQIRDAFDWSAAIVPLPAELGIADDGFRVSSSNRTDDLFMYLSRRLTVADGIDARKRYLASFDIAFASEDPAGLGGIGGPPAEAVFLKAGGVGRELGLVQVADGAGLELNVDKGGNGVSRPDGDLSIAGDIANGGPADRNSPFRIVRRLHTHPSPVRPRHDGLVSIVVGTDSGFEGVTTLYYVSIALRLTPT